jgi:16S rRNA (adenine1518-N6/adenine1519-N6)-dimethyltransferase
MLRAALAGPAGSSAAASAAIEAAGVDPQLRGEMLEVGAFAAIAERLAMR